MAELSSYLSEPTRDRLNVFVSSRLKECASERTVAKDGIESINHIPVLFEHIGARSASPRRLYISRLRESQIMVAIYKNGYGYIDTSSGMQISGLEDEARFAQSNGIPILLYVHREDAAREPRLQSLISELSSNLTIWFYSSEDQLFERIRNDVTAEITKLVISPARSKAIVENSAAKILSRSTRRNGRLIRRSHLLQAISDKIDQSNAVCIWGVPGIGKTTIAAQLAEQRKGLFVQVSGLAPLDLFLVLSALVRGTTYRPSVFSSLTAARSEFVRAWKEADCIELVVDECAYPEELLSAIDFAGGTTKKKTIVFTSRDSIDSLVGVEVPYLSTSEVREIAGTVTLKSSPQTPSQVQKLLYEQLSDSSKPSGVANEVMSYLSLSESPIAAPDILLLIGDEELTIDALYSALESVGWQIDDGPEGFQIAHANIKVQLFQNISKAPQRHKFYSNRLISLLQKRGDLKSCYRIARNVDDSTAKQFAFPALRQAILVGDVRLGREIAEWLLAGALGEERRSEALDLMLALVYPLEMMGDSLRASELLDRAAKIAEQLEDDDAKRVEEVALSSRARRTLSATDVTRLIELRERYIEEGQQWDAARLGLELSALYIASKSYEHAVTILRSAVSDFDELGDEYGLDLSERNLAASLAAISGNEAEVDQLLRRIQVRARDGQDNRRQRAWENNILSRRYRVAGRLDDAERVARETIEIGGDLGDRSLEALTYINLGNILRDKGDVPSAIQAYKTAGEQAQRCGRRDIEADSSRLQAAMYNEKSPQLEENADNYKRAKIFAQHAIGLLRDTVYHESLAWSFMELADAEFHLYSKTEAARAYFQGAREFQKVPDTNMFGDALIRGFENALDSSPELYVREMAEMFCVEIDETSSLADQFSDLIQPIIIESPRFHLVRMLGRHLQCVRSQLPPLLKPVVLRRLVDAVHSCNLSGDSDWRVLYVGLLIPYLSQDTQADFHLRRYAEIVTRRVAGIDVRYCENGDTVWTVRLETKPTVTLSIMPMDDSIAAHAASQSLAMFLKAFEESIDELVGGADISEITIQISAYDEMPTDLRDLVNSMFNLEEMLEEQSVAVSRTDDFGGETPTMVFLHPAFTERAFAGEGISGSQQMLYAFTLVEVVHQLLAGEVEHGELRPKVSKLVSQTLS